MAFDRDTKSIFLNYYNKILEDVARPVEVSGPQPEDNTVRPGDKISKNDAIKQWEAASGKSYSSLTPAQKQQTARFIMGGMRSGTVPVPPGVTAKNQTAATSTSAPATATTSNDPNKDAAIAEFDRMTATGQPGAPNPVAAQAQNTLSQVPTLNPITGKAEASKAAPSATTSNDPNKDAAIAEFDRMTATGQPGAPSPVAAQVPTFNTMANISGVAPVQASAPKAQPTASSTMQQAATNLSNTNTQQQMQQAAANTNDQARLAAFKKMHGTSFDPNSSMDRRKMAQMTGQTAVTNAMPGSNTKPGQIKTAPPAPSTATRPGGQFNKNAEVRRGVPANLPPGYVERQNSKLPGVFGTASNMLGRIGDTAQNVAMGTVGKVNPSPTAPPQAPATQTKTTQAPKAKPTNANPKVR